MEALKTDGRISLGGLESPHLVILRHAVPSKCKPVVAQRFKTVAGTILAIQMPLPIRVLESLTIPRSATDIHAVLTCLQLVIILDKDTPQIYHKSFFDFLTTVDHCTEDLFIDLRAHHTRITMRCFQIMNKRLKRNILELGDPARFMDNAEGLAAQEISEGRLHLKIPAELRYACIYWINHVEGADTEDADLVKECERFTSERLLHWLETLSWIGKLDIAHRALRSIPKLLNLSSPDMLEMVRDTFRLVCKNYEAIKRSALHTYHSALVFTPTQQLLYQRHCKEMTHNTFWLRGGLAQWDPLVATVSHPTLGAGIVLPIFSCDSSQLVSCTEKDMRFWDAMSGTPISRSNLGGYDTALADDFSIVAIPCDNAIKLHNVATDTPVATFTHSSELIRLALSHGGSRLAAALSNDTITLWDVQKHEPTTVPGSLSAEVDQLMFSPSTTCILASLSRGEIQLWNGSNGEFIANLNYGSEEHVEFTLSRGGSRLASLTTKGKVRSLTLWNSENGNFIGAAKDVGKGGAYSMQLAISDDGAFLATAKNETVKLWSGVGGDSLSHIDSIQVGAEISLAFSRELFATASISGDVVKVYNLRSRTIISTLQFSLPVFLAISPAGTRLAAGNEYGEVRLWDTASIKASNPASSNCVTRLAFSPDCSRLTAGFDDGTVELWNTDQAGQPIASHNLHSDWVRALAFSPDGEQLASGSEDETVRVWDGRDGSTSSVLEHTFPDSLRSVAFSSGLLAASTGREITIWDRKTLCLIDTIRLSSLSLPSSFVCCSLSFSVGGSSLAMACTNSSESNVMVCQDIRGRTALAAFQVNCRVRELTLSPNGLQVFAKTGNDSFRLFDVSTGNTIQQTRREDLSWIPNFNGIPILWNRDRGNHLMGRFSERYEHIPLLHFPAEVRISRVAVGSSMFAVGSKDGRILLVRS